MARQTVAVGSRTKLGVASQLSFFLARNLATGSDGGDKQCGVVAAMNNVEQQQHFPSPTAWQRLRKQWWRLEERHW